MIALIPCRTGSKRIKRKNFRDLGGKALWRWTYEAAVESEVFQDIRVCTDPGGVDMLPGYIKPIVQEPPLHRDDCRDQEWVSDALNRVPCEEFSILRPTSPFRDAACIKRAKEQWEATKDRLDSMRAMRRAMETGWKQWVVEDWLTPPTSCQDCGEPLVRQSCGCCWLSATDKNRDFCPSSPTPKDHEPAQDPGVFKTMRPLTTAAAKKHLHSFPTQSLEDTYIQTAGLEIIHARTVLEKGTIAGDQVGMFEVSGPEALDLNTESDWAEAERLLERP